MAAPKICCATSSRWKLGRRDDPHPTGQPDRLPHASTQVGCRADQRGRRRQTWWARQPTGRGGALSADFQAIDKSLTEIQRQVKYLDEIRTWSGTIKNSAEKVIDRVERMQKALDVELETLGQQVEQLKSVAG